MTRISLSAHINFVFMSRIDLMYGLTNEIKIHTLNHDFDNTMVIYTTEDDVMDDEQQLELLDSYHLVEEKMFHEYVISYDNINRYK